MQKFSSIIIFTVFLLTCHSASAGVVTDLETRISKDRNIQFVTISLSKAPNNMNVEQKVDSIKAVRYNGGKNKFSADVLIDGRLYTLEGKYEEASLIPAFKNYVNKGHIIEYTDLISVKVPNKRLNQDLYNNNDDLVGKSAKRKLPPNQPIKAKDVATPNILEKGTNVKMVFKKGGLLIEAQGITLEGGAEGDKIKVKNLDSNKIVKAKIIDEATVTTNG